MNKKENQTNWNPNNHPFTESDEDTDVDLNRYINGVIRKEANVEESIRYIDKTILREKNKPTRFFVDNEYVDKGFLAAFPHQVTSVYMALLKHCNTKTQTAYPGLKTLQRLTGIKNRNSLITSISMLEEYNILTIVRSKGGTNNPNMYGFVSSHEWSEIDPINKSKKLTIKQYQKMHQWVPTKYLTE